MRAMPGTVLVVEDEPEIAALLRDFLDDAGFGVVVAGDAEEALTVLDERQVVCAVVDVMLPAASGFDLCRRVRETSDLPLLFLTARGDDSDKLRGLGLGADDYIVKYATPAEVVARVKAVLRRSRACRDGPAPRCASNGRPIDLAAREVPVDDRARPASPPASSISSSAFAEHPRQVFTRDQLFELLWGAYGDRHTLTVHIRRLREKIEDDPAQPQLIVTVWGVGYRFDPPGGR